MNQIAQTVATMSIARRIELVCDRITEAERLYGRKAGSVALLAVSKTRPASDIRQALDGGQTTFGENYLQEALEKMGQLAESAAKWHYIGRIQSNKTRPIAENFDWVHSVDKLKLLRRLNEQRPESLPPLNVCLQINLDQEQSKGGLTAEAAAEIVAQAGALQRLRIRGLMTIPAPAPDFESQRRPFLQLRLLRNRIATTEIPLETLSMGMSADLEAAIAEGATMIRVGTAIFGPRQPAAGERPVPPEFH